MHLKTSSYKQSTTRLESKLGYFVESKHLVVKAN